MSSLRRRIGSLVAATAAAVGLMVAVPSAAQAGTVTMTWACATVLGSAGPRTMAITVTAPATARVGETVTVRGSWANVGSGYHPVPAAAGAYRGWLSLSLGGASTGGVELQGMANPEIAEGEQFRMEGGQAQVTLDTAGEVTFAPTGQLYSGPSIGLSCSNGGRPGPVAATIRVS